jgi:hypothetical protein
MAWQIIGIVETHKSLVSQNFGCRKVHLVPEGTGYCDRGEGLIFMTAMSRDYASPDTYPHACAHELGHAILVENMTTLPYPVTKAAFEDFITT